ncbi:MAG: phenylalanine--tRNA ligase subunit beta [Planctomycetes bacterium]|nr:phenylalanine--tRNA ligase subunit beta [Planctomycetota bacterium]
MKISLNWLTDYVDVTIPAAELAERMMAVGLNIEGIAETDSDIVLDVEVTSNRPDCLGHIGVAREVGAMTGRPLRLPNLGDIPMSGQVGDVTSVEVLAPEFCPRYTARVIRGVKVGPSPAWMVERLNAVGLRSINNVVDVTNYVLMEYSQPLHAFDLDKLAGRRIIVRWAKDGELITAIDGGRYELHDWMGVIADTSRPVAIAGVMGGLDTEVSDSTTNLLIESAQFDPLSIRRTSRALGLMSEASYRFERAVDPVALERASLRTCQLILQIAGGELLGGVADAWHKAHRQAVVSLRPRRTNALLGVEIPRDRQAAILESLGLQVKDNGESIVCTIPPYRGDLTREVDLIEELGRIHGYDQIPVGGTVTHEVTPPSLLEWARRTVGEVLNAAGYDEAITFTFIDEAEAELFGWADSLSVDPRLRKTNGTLRQGLMPSLLRARKVNQDAGNEAVHLFELASVFPPAKTAGDGDLLPQEYTQLGLLTDGSLREVRGAVEAVVRRFDPAWRVRVRADEVQGFRKGTAAELFLVLGGDDAVEKLGVMGVVDEKVCDYYGLGDSPAGAMVRFDLLAPLRQAARSYKPVPRFPPIRRDLSVVVPEPVTWEHLAKTIGMAGGDLMEQLDYVDTYRGKQAGPGRKSVTMRLTYRHAGRTLRHEEVDAAVAEVVAALKNEHQAELRVL